MPPDPTGRQLTIRYGDADATVVEVGGGIRTFRVGGTDVVDGYDRSAMASSGRGQVLIPWPNRLDSGRYAWDGDALQVPIDEPERSNAIHGLVRFSGWKGRLVADQRAELRTVLWPSPGYPFRLRLAVVYELGDNGLSVTTTARNAGDRAAPYGAGQHPYLVPPGGVSVDACELSVPAARYLEVDARGLPVTTHPVAGTRFDFGESRPIGALQLDTAYTGLSRDRSGRARVQLRGPGRTVTVWFDEPYRWVQVFTGDTVAAPRRRTGIAVEPMTCPPNAFATGVDVARLEPGESIRSRWGLTVADG